MCQIYDCDDRYSVFLKTTQRSRKERRCGECRRLILEGELYKKTKGLLDGHWAVCIYCEHCTVATEWLTKECGGYLDENVTEEIKEHAEEYRSVALARLVVGINRKWLRFDKEWLMSIPKMPPLTKDHHHDH